MQIVHAVDADSADPALRSGICSALSHPVHAREAPCQDIVICIRLANGREVSAR
jgi:hypothetical protein